MPTPQYNQDEMWKIYEKLPEELKQAVFSAENADHTFSICERHGVNECSKVASLIGLVLMGVLLPRNFEAALVKDLGLDSDTAQRVAQEVNRFIFYPVKQQLEQLHAKFGEQESEIEIPTPRHSDDYLTKRGQTQEQEKPVFTEEQQQTEKDTYRETIE